MENLVQYLIYKKNPLRQLGIIGLKRAHLEADIERNKKILDESAAEFGPHQNLTNAQRTLAQFKCQEALYDHALQKWISRLIFAAAGPIVLGLFVLKNLKHSPKRPVKVFVFNLGSISYAKSEFLTEDFLSGSVGKDIGVYLGFKEIKFMAQTVFSNPQYILHPKLIVNVMRWLAAYAWVVKYHEPKTIATFFEGTASSSLLTQYLNDQGIQHYNFAHGEHFRFDCYSAYANFNRYVIWGRHFENVQIEKHCRSEMFSIRAPDHFKKYFFEIRNLQKINQKQLTVLIHSGVEKGRVEYDHLLGLLKELPLRWKVVLRPHPVDRASWPQVKVDLEIDLQKSGYPMTLDVELPERIPMTESVKQSPVFVGSASAALLEALLAGCKIIYLPGRLKNPDVIERHRISVNVFSFQHDNVQPDFKTFINSEFVKTQDEDFKIHYLFELD